MTLAYRYTNAMDLDTYLTQVETASSLSKRSGILQVLLSQWRKGVRPVPFDKCVVIEKNTNGLVTRKDLRPEDWFVMWPELSEPEN